MKLFSKTLFWHTQTQIFMHVTLWSSVFNETFVGPQLDKKFSITMFIVPILSLSNPVHALQFNTSPLHLGVPSGLFLSHFKQ